MDGWKAIDAAKDSEIHVNTVKKYFKIWNAKIFKNEEKEFFRDCKIAKEHALLKLEKRLQKLETHSDRIENKLELIDWSFSPEYGSYHDRYDDLQIKIAKLELEIYDLKSKPTADIRLKVDVRSFLKEQKNSGGSDDA